MCSRAWITWAFWFCPCAVGYPVCRHKSRQFHTSDLASCLFVYLFACFLLGTSKSGDSFQVLLEELARLRILLNGLNEFLHLGDILEHFLLAGESLVFSTGLALKGIQVGERLFETPGRTDRPIVVVFVDVTHRMAATTGASCFLAVVFLGIDLVCGRCRSRVGRNEKTSIEGGTAGFRSSSSRETAASFGQAGVAATAATSAAVTGGVVAEFQVVVVVVVAAAAAQTGNVKETAASVGGERPSTAAASATPVVHRRKTRIQSRLGVHRVLRVVHRVIAVLGGGGGETDLGQHGDVAS
jgi:hypothetical protein